MDTTTDTVPDLKTVYSLIKSFYLSDPKPEVHRNMEAIQDSVYGWTIADQILSDQNSDIYCRIFAAQILKNKIEKHFQQLPQESYSQLKDKIIQHLRNNKETVVRTQLSLAITYLAILVPEWTHPIEELARQVPDVSILIEILICLAEEVQGERNAIRIGGKRKAVFSDYLKQISNDVIQLLMKTLSETKINWNQENSQTQEQLLSDIYKCLGAWLRFIDVSVINQIEPILTSAFEALRNPNCPKLIHDSASNTICDTAILCEEYQTYQQLTHYLLNQVYQLETAYHLAVANEDTEKVENYTKVITELAESVIDPLIINEVDLKILDLLLTCCGHYDIEIIDITFYFWYMFSEKIYNRRTTTFIPHCNRLMAALTKHCQLDSDCVALLDYKSDLYELRCRVKDLVKEMIPTIGIKNYINGNNIIDTLKTVNAWEVIESNLFIISCIIGQKVEPDDNQMIAEIINLVLNYTSVNQSSQHIQIYATICNILGELSDWLKSNAMYLDAVLNFLLNMIANCHKIEELSSHAAQALQKIIESCASQHLVGNHNLISILIQICSQIDLIKSAEASTNLVQCCAAIISASDQNQDHLVAQLLTPHLERLQDLVNNKANESQIVIYFDRIAAIFRKMKLSEVSLHSPILASLVNDQLWPLASIALTAYAATNPHLIERCSRCLRFLIRSFKPSWLLQPIVNQIVPLYQQFPNHTSFLYLGSILVDEFASENDITISSGLIRMLNEFSLTTFKLLCDSQLRQHPDTIDDFFRLCTRILQKCSNAFLNNDMLDNILKLLIAAMPLEHQDANGSVVKFAIELIEVKNYRHLIEKLLKEGFGQKLMDAVINASLFHLPSYMVTDMTDILWSLISFDRNAANEWLANSLKSVPAQNNTTMTTASTEQLEDFYKDCIKASNPKLIANSLRYLARLYR
ncbi:transportin-3-like [Oppia nitens]|uniref:transportin-3-like n=1 Tax=Oppia nitens TaxID=1686743 RepID=UPI0023DBA3BA|nr:transportin-3-like [Oppia nitens]